MLKKITIACVTCFMLVTLVGCSNSSDTKKEDTSDKTEESKTREFTESKGVIKYITIDGGKIAIPETVGEYIGYLEKIGKVELGDTGKEIKDAPKMAANERASLASYLKVYPTSSQFQTFGINYVNSKDKEANVADATVTRISLTYDIYADEKTPEDQLIKTMVLVTANGEIPMNGKTTSANIMKILGSPEQNTDGYLKYTDDAGFTYKFATENQKGILTKVQIDYPKN